MVHTCLAKGFTNLVAVAGKQIGLTYYTQAIGSVWDDDVTLTKSGSTIWTSGIVQPLSSHDSLLVEQGKLIDNDLRLYSHGSLLITGSEFQIEIQLGSATTTDQLYTTIPLGAIMWEAEGVPVYKKTFIRKLSTGSLTGR